MRITSLALVLLLVPNAALAQNAGINMHWNDCTLGANSMDLVSDCTPTGAPHELVVSLAGTGRLESVNGAQITVDMLVATAVLPDFWRMESGGCRQRTLVADVTIGSTSPPYSCPEPWSGTYGGPGGQAGGVIFEPFMNGPNRGRITGLIAVPTSTTIDFDGFAPEWYVMGIHLQKAGSATCEGCTTPTCFIANQVRLTRPPGTSGGDLFITAPASSQVTTWFGGQTISCFVPIRNRTWGQVKSLYR